jgi:NitT/TauT family transport system substrate-binding protein
MHQFRLVVTLSVVILSAVSQFESASAQTRLAIGYAAVSPRTTPLYLAQEQGIFSKYGLDPKIVLVRAAATLVATLVSGEMDVGYTGGTSVLGAAGQGSYLKILSSISNTLTHTLVAHPSLKRAEELRGKRFGIQNPGGTTWINTILALEHIGLDYKRDNINLLPIGDSVLVGQALEAGRVDAAVLDGALVRRLRSKGFAIVTELQPAKIPCSAKRSVSPSS